MKKCQRAGFLSPSEAPKSYIVTKEKKSRKGEEKERRKKEKSNGYNTATSGDRFWPKKLSDPKAPLGDNVIKNPARPVKKENCHSCNYMIYADSTIFKLRLYLESNETTK